MKICANTLTTTSVSIKSDEYGMRAYVNSTRGRAQLETECPTDIVKEVDAVWGSAPTVTEPIPTGQPNQTPEQDIVNAELMMHLAKLEKAVTT